MKGLARQGFTLVVSAALSWWICLGLPQPEPVPAPPQPERLPVVLTPVPLETPVPSSPSPAAKAQPTAAPEDPAPPEQEAVAQAAPSEGEQDLEPEPEPVPPPAELGAPDGEGEAAAEEAGSADENEVAEAETQASEHLSSEEAMQSEELLSAARSELAGDVRPGFATVLLAAPEEQLDIARFFGEEIVLVPKSALDGDSSQARYFRLVLDPVPRVEAVAGTGSLEGYRQYRDLFDYEYARLPDPLRELRRSVLARTEIYLFGALIPAHEWAVVVQRRREALARAGRDASEARRFVLQYRPRRDGGFDLDVEAIVFADGTRFRPPTNNTSSHESP